MPNDVLNLVSRSCSGQSIEVDGVVVGDRPEEHRTELGMALGALVGIGVDAIFKIVVHRFTSLLPVEPESKLRAKDLKEVLDVLHNPMESGCEGHIEES